MKPDTHTVQQLFERDVRYIVPLYQRPYVWDEEHQWAPLWDDITAMLQHQDSGQVAGLWTHFLGAIVLDGERPVPGQIPRFMVIDGLPSSRRTGSIDEVSESPHSSHHFLPSAQLIRFRRRTTDRRSGGADAVNIRNAVAGGENAAHGGCDPHAARLE